MPYKGRGQVRIKLFRASTAEELENTLNKWLTSARWDIIDIRYQYSGSGGGDVFSCMVSYTEAKVESSM